jgi:hypothetical protein
MREVKRAEALKKTVKTPKAISIKGRLRTERSGDIGLFKAAIEIGIIKAGQPRTVKKRKRVIRSL